MVVDPSEGDRRVAVICLTLITSNPRLASPSDISSGGGGVVWQVAYHRLYRFFGFGVEGVIGQLWASKWDLTDYKFAMPLPFTNSTRPA
jgi:hypothetical protein